MIGPVDIVAILTDLQQQISDLTGVVEAQQRTLNDLSLLVQSQEYALRHLLPESPSLAPTPISPGGA